MAFTKEADFEAAIINLLTEHGWEKEVLRNPTEQQLIQNWADILFQNNRGIDRLDEYAARFGLGEESGIELGEETGVVAGRAYTESLGGTWYEGSVTSVAIGQESTQVTPLQLANYIATLVNGGTRNAAHLLKEVKSSDFTQVVYSYQPQVLGTIDIQPQNLSAVKAGMLTLTTQGSVRQAFQDLPFQVGAKTGTAQTGGTSSNAHSVFVCLYRRFLIHNGSITA